MTQVSVLVALRMLGPQDRDAVDAWIKFHGTAEERKTVLASLGALPIGRAWVWSPGWLGILKQVQIRKRTTFDSSSTPGIGAKRVRPETLAPVDLDALTSKIAATIEKTKAEDPKALRKRIADLERDLTAAKSAKPVDVVPQVVRVDVPVIDAKAITALERLVQVTGEQHETARALLESCEAILASAVASRAVGLPAAPTRQNRKPLDTSANHPTLSTKKAIRSDHTNGAGSGLGRCARGILTALVQHGPLSLVQAAIIAGYAPDSGGVRNAAGELRTGGYAEGGNDQLTRTRAGETVLGDYQRLPVGAALGDYWLAKLSKCEREILRVVLDRYPNPVSLTAAAERAGYVADSGGVRNAAGRLRTLALVHGGNSGMTADERLVD